MSEPTKATTEELDEMAIKAARLSTEQLLDALDLAERTGEWWPEDGLHAAIRSRVAGYDAMAEAVKAAKEYRASETRLSDATTHHYTETEYGNAQDNRMLKRAALDAALARVERDEEKEEK